VAHPNIEIIQRGLSAFNSFDVEAGLKVSHPSIEWWTSTSFVHGKPYRGHDGIRQYFADRAEVWQDLDARVDSMLAVGDHVLMLGRFVGRGQESGTPTNTRAGWLWQIRDGLIYWGRTYFDQMEAVNELVRREGEELSEG
jgi:ketosteroid isomerase-like protein